MAMKSSKIAVTLEPSLKQKLREYGKENQIKNFSGVILSILDEHFGTADTSASPPTDLWQTIRELTARVDQLEGGTATTTSPKEKPKKVIKPKATTKTTTAKPKVVKSASKVAKPEKPAKPVKKASAKTATKSSAKSAATKAKSTTKSTRSTKSASKAAPVKKAKAGSTRGASTRKSSKTKASKNQWMSTREAFDMYGGNLSWSRFSKLTPEELKERFNLDSDLSRKVRGSRFNQWLTLGK